MTLFEAIRKFIKEKDRNAITMQKNRYNIDKYLVIFDRIYQQNNEFIQEGENIIDTIINIIRKAGISDDITVTKSNELILKKLAELLDSYGPFLKFTMLPCDFFGDYYLDFSIYGGYGGEYGKIKCDDFRDNREEQDIEEVFLESICSARAELAVVDEKTTLSRIAKYIEYENSRSEYNDAVAIIKKENKRYSALVRTNSLLGSNPSDVTEVRRDNGILYPVMNKLLYLILEKNKKIKEYISGYCDTEEYFNKLDSCIYDGVESILDDFEDEHIILRISQNIDQKGRAKSYPKYFFKVQFKDTSENEILAETYNRNVRTALFDAVKEMMKKYQINFS